LLNGHNKYVEGIFNTSDFIKDSLGDSASFYLLG